MDRDHYLAGLREKIDDWEADLEVLQDEADRSDEDIKDEYLTSLSDLYRNLEDLIIRVDELEEVSEDEFEEGKEMLEEIIEQFESDMREAREKIEDV